MQARRLIWSITLLLVLIGLAAVARRTYVLMAPGPAPTPAMAALDSNFAARRVLTCVHIFPAALLIVLMPLQFVERIRARHIGFHRWSGRLILVLGAVVGTTALIMSYRMAIGGANETAATTLFATLFLLFLALGFWNVRRGRIARHREWMIRAFGVMLGIATTRPIMGAFFAAHRLSPHEFFGIAFWLGFSLTLLGAEAWIQYSQASARHA